MTAADRATDSATVRRVRIEGQVQGVWFRAWTVEQAQERLLHGWVRNRLDGSVEALFSGSAERVQAMIAACHQGPPAAQVTAVHAEPAAPPETIGFHLWPTL